MRLKYYLRGAGSGILVATLLLTIAYAFAEPAISDEDVIARAKKLGMVEAQEIEGESEDAEDQKSQDASEDAEDQKSQDVSEDAEDQKSQDASDDSEDQKGQDAKVVSFQISSGETSDEICQHLEDLGLVDSGSSFDLFLADMDKDNSLMPGTYEIPAGSSFLEILQILTK
jgi:hypothetical protein